MAEKNDGWIESNCKMKIARLKVRGRRAARHVNAGAIYNDVPWLPVMFLVVVFAWMAWTLYGPRLEKPRNAIEQHSTPIQRLP